MRTLTICISVVILCTVLMAQPAQAQFGASGKAMWAHRGPNHNHHGGILREVAREVKHVVRELTRPNYYYRPMANVYSNYTMPYYQTSAYTMPYYQNSAYTMPYYQNSAYAMPVYQNQIYANPISSNVFYNNRPVAGRAVRGSFHHRR